LPTEFIPKQKTNKFTNCI